jgi:hypothetical protein
MIPLVTVAGTWSWDADWRRRGAPLMTFLATQGFEQYRVDGRLFQWTTDVNGARIYKRLLPRRFRADHGDWFAGGWALCSHLFDRLGPANTHLWTHSHGLQVALSACALGLKVTTLTDVSGPVRAEFLEPNPSLLLELFGAECFEQLSADDKRTPLAELARRNIGYWQHLHSDSSDRTQWFGTVGDGALGIVREHPRADSNILFPKAGHSGVLNDIKWFDQLLMPLASIRARHVPVSTRSFTST